MCSCLLGVPRTVGRQEGEQLPEQREYRSRKVNHMYGLWKVMHFNNYKILIMIIIMSYFYYQNIAIIRDYDLIIMFLGCFTL